MRFKRSDGSETIDTADAQVLEDYEKIQFENHRTRRAIHDTYKSEWGTTSGKIINYHPTKKRRKLPGKRSWKNKSREYIKIEGHMSKREFNAKGKAMRTLDKLFKQEAQKRRRHSLVD